MAAAADPGFAVEPAALAGARSSTCRPGPARGQAYDDDVPPPPATLTVDGSGRDPVSGLELGPDRPAIARLSPHAGHGPLGAGRATARDWPLHLAESHVAGPDSPAGRACRLTLGDLAGLPAAAPIAGALAAAQAAIDAAVAAFPDCAAVATAALRRALRAVRAARADVSRTTARDEILHRLDAKEAQLGHVIRLALGVEARGRTGEICLRPGAEHPAHGRDSARARPTTSTVAFDLPQGWRMDGDTARAGRRRRAERPLSRDLRSRPRPARRPCRSRSRRMAVSGRDPAAVRDAAGRPARAHGARLAPEAALVNLPGRDRAPRRSRCRDVCARRAPRSALALPPGWTATRTDDGLRRSRLPDDVRPGALHACPLTLDGAAARTVAPDRPSPCRPDRARRPPQLRLRVLDVTVPDVRVGYIGGGQRPGGPLARRASARM